MGLFYNIMLFLVADLLFTIMLYLVSDVISKTLFDFHII